MDEINKLKPIEIPHTSKLLLEPLTFSFVVIPIVVIASKFLSWLTNGFVTNLFVLYSFTTLIRRKPILVNSNGNDFCIIRSRYRILVEVSLEDRLDKSIRSNHLLNLIRRRNIPSFISTSSKKSQISIWFL